MRTPFHYEYCNLIAESCWKNEHFFAVPYNVDRFAPEPDFKFPPVKPTWKYPFCVNITSEEICGSESKVISGLPEAKEQRDEKTPSVLVISEPMLTSVEQELPRTLVGPGHLDVCIQVHNISTVKEPYTAESNIIFEEESLDESTLENRNPNARGRACVSCEISRSETSLETIEVDCNKDMVLSPTSSQITLPDESCVPDFMVNSPSSESMTAFREKKLLMVSPRKRWDKRIGPFVNEE